MKKTFSFSLGNTGLLPSEEGLVQLVNEKLQASAKRHHKHLKPAYELKVKTFKIGDKTVRRAARGDSEPVVIPLASA